MPPSRMPNYLALLGMAIEITWYAGKGYSRLTVEQWMERFHPPMTKGCIVLENNNRGWVEAFATYGFFEDTQHQRLLADPGYTPPVDAWERDHFEGSHLWVMDVISPGEGYGPRLIRQLLPLAIAGERVHWWRIVPGRDRPVLISKVVKHG